MQYIAMLPPQTYSAAVQAPEIEYEYRGKQYATFVSLEGRR